MHSVKALIGEQPFQGKALSGNSPSTIKTVVSLHWCQTHAVVSGEYGPKLKDYNSFIIYNNVMTQSVIISRQKLSGIFVNCL